jgi:TPR repeat protein
MEALRDSVPEDRRIMDALETYASGFHLSRRIFEEAQLNSLPRMEEAARKWRELGDTEREEQSVRTIAIIERQLGIIYVLRHAGPDLSRKWFEKALGWYRQTAERGDSEAETVMGDFYAFGWAVDQDFTQARQWYQKAAKQGHARAENNLGWLSQWGLGGKRDYRAAMRSYLKAAAEGNAVAKTNLGMMYRDGLGVAKNSAQEQGDSRAKDLVSSLSELRTSN